LHTRESRNYAIASNRSLKKKKIINDPVYGFITLPDGFIFDLIEHPAFQRLRHIRQLGLSDLVYPGALHSRFHHALGAFHLMGRALDGLRQIGVEISPQEYEAAQAAILLHDIGHGPFSHALEESLLQNAKHESLSYLFMDYFNREFGGALDLTLKMFRNSYPRKFFHQLISSQLDVDRLDYLHRDSFFTGVHEGTVGVDRIISMMNVRDNHLVVEEKGIYSIEGFLNARRVMYWQVYLHKTAVAAERMLVNLIRRAKYLAESGEEVPASQALSALLTLDGKPEDYKSRNFLLDIYGRLDDNDIWGAIKLWQSHSDPVLSALSRMLLHRKLFSIKLGHSPVRREEVENLRQRVASSFRLLQKDASYLLASGSVSNEAYVAEGQSIRILMKDGEIRDIAQASDLPSIKAMSKIVRKNYLCWPKNLSL
jgi:hypothetical protein